VILVDTSVWIDHLRTGDDTLVALLEAGDVATHPFILGELACGNLRNRAEVLGLLTDLPRVTSATDDEVLAMIERRSMMARGIGYTDAHLLASVAITPETRLWSRDKRLTRIARELGL